MKYCELNDKKKMNSMPPPRKAVPRPKYSETLCSKKLNCFKTLTEGHKAIQAKLKKALIELTTKKCHLKKLQEEFSKHRDNSWMLQERVRLKTENSCFIMRALELKETKHEEFLKELVYAKWRLQEANQFVDKFKSDQASHQSKCQDRTNEWTRMERRLAPGSDSTGSEKIQEDIMLLLSYKTRLNNGDAKQCAIRDGTRLMEMEQKKQALKDAMSDRGVPTELMYVEIDEKAEMIEQLKEQQQSDEVSYRSQMNQLKNQLQCLSETEERLKRSVDYMQARIDYGITTATAPPPWSQYRYIQ